MLKRDGLWDVAKATVWLRQHEWGEGFITMLIYDSSPGERLQRWLEMVINIYAAMYGSGLPIFAPASGAESWDVRRASAWISQYPFGPPLLRQLEADPSAERVDRFLGMVSNIHSVMHGYGAPPGMFWNEARGGELADGELLRTSTGRLID